MSNHATGVTECLELCTERGKHLFGGLEPERTFFHFLHAHLGIIYNRGVRYVFGYTGGAIMPVLDEMERQKAFAFIMSRYKQGAAFMAQGVPRAFVSTVNPNPAKPEPN